MALALATIYHLGDLINDYVLNPALRNDLSLRYLATADERGPQQVEAMALKRTYTRLDSSKDARILCIRQRTASKR